MAWARRKKNHTGNLRGSGRLTYVEELERKVERMQRELKRLRKVVSGKAQSEEK